jgi:hypothetical protein
MNFELLQRHIAETQACKKSVFALGGISRGKFLEGWPTALGVALEMERL